MKADEIQAGKYYVAKVSRSLTVVRVDNIRPSAIRRSRISYDVTNIVTNRRTSFASAAKFRREARPAEIIANQRMI